jgi:hypothetical protein
VIAEIFVERCNLPQSGRWKIERRRSVGAMIDLKSGLLASAFARIDDTSPDASRPHSGEIAARNHTPFRRVRLAQSLLFRTP